MSPEVLDFEMARSKMIEQQIRPWNVLDPNVLEILHRVHREDFVPSQHRHLAFVDMEIPLPEGQVMLAPKIEARMLQELNLTPSDRVLEIGTGSGHMAALLAQVAANVLSIEKYSSLADMARENLTKAGISNVEIQQANGLAEDPRWAHTGFDCVVISRAAGCSRPPDAKPQIGRKACSHHRRAAGHAGDSRRESSRKCRRWSSYDRSF